MPMAAAADAPRDEDVSLRELQQHLQLEPFEGKYLTRQEVLLLELFRSVAGDDDGDAQGGAASSAAATNGAGAPPSVAAGSSTPGKALASKSAVGLATASAGTTALKRQQSSDRERVQSFLAQRTGGSTGGASASGKPALSAVERAKLLMAKKAGGSARTSGPAGVGGGSAAVKRTNPLTDILKGGSGSVVGGVHSAKRARTRSDKPGEIRINGGRGSIQLPLESFMLREDWDSSTQPPLELVLPEVAFATNNTLIVHATMPARAARCCLNVSTQASLLSGAPYPGTVLYHFNPRRQRGGLIVQNSNIDGRWGCAQPLPRCPITFGEPFTLRLTIAASGFLVFLEEVFQDEFRHRVPIREGENLVLTAPTRDEGGGPEGLIVHSVWWGHAEVPANLEPLRRAAGGGSGVHRPRGAYDRSGGARFHPPPHPFEVYVGNLPQGTSRDELSFLFQYLGYETVRITARGFGFVTLRSAEDMHRAVEDLDGKEFNGMKLRVSCALPPK